MKRWILIMIVLLLSSVAWGQDTGNGACPSFQLQGPNGIVGDGWIVPFYVRWTDGPGNLKPGYKWQTFGAAELIGGQGTMIVEVKVFAHSNNTVSVEISGLPAGCQNTARETLAITLAPVANKLDEYAGPLTRIPKSRLERILKALKENPGSRLDVIVSGGGENPRTAISHKRKVVDRDLLSEFEGTPPVTIIEHLQGNEDKLVIWLVPPGAAPPYR